MKRRLSIYVSCIAASIVFAHSAVASPASLTVASASALARPAGLERDITFWRRVYTEISTNEGFLHDDRRLDVVYETLQLPKNASERARRNKARATADKYSTMLVRIAGKKRENLTDEEERVRALWGDDADATRLREASRRVRFQLGQSNKFREGLIRAGAWQAYIRKALDAAGVPPEVAYLPHVESSFNPVARSHVGAVGLWQFMPSTARRYMRVDHVIDERLDPYRSSDAAALLMQHNYEVTNNWPLAITAYNHGASGMRRAIAQVGTDDVERVVRTYRSRSFGFASRNFYVAFLAAVDVASDPQRYFNAIEPDAADTSEVFEVPGYIPAGALAVALGVDSTTLARWNPSLLRPVWSGQKLVPRGFTLRVPPSAGVDFRSQLAGIAKGEWKPRQTPDLFHVVQRGETLSSIAPRYGTRVSDLVALNALPSQHRLRIGQRLVLPAAKGVASEAVVDDGVYSQAAEAANPPPPIVVAVIPKPPPRAAEATAPSIVVTTVDAPVVQTPARDVAAAIESDKTATKGSDPFVAAPEAATPSIVATTEATPVIQTPAGEVALVTVQTGLATDAEVEVDVVPSEAVADASTMTDADATASAETTAATEAPIGAPVDVEATLALAGTERGAAPETAIVLVPELKADPADYLVADDGSIRIQDGESLGHFADWLGITASTLRRLNGLGGKSVIRVGRPLKLDFSKATREEFEQRRMAYHQGLQEAFFARHRIAGTNEHVVRRGESVWVLAERRYKVPVWLLRQYNPDVDLALLKPGTRVVIPVLIDREEEPPADGLPT